MNLFILAAYGMGFYIYYSFRWTRAAQFSVGTPETRAAWKEFCEEEKRAHEQE